MYNQKRIITIQDISCLGRCSITVALPVLSCAGIETTILPTAMLSTHTGGFTGFTCKDLESEIMPIVNHWMSLDDVHFDCIYTGYLASGEQIKLVMKVFEMIKEKNNLYIMVDPAMADNGKMYPAFTDEFSKEMKKLCEKADVIVPNLTEACKMLDIEYKDGAVTKEYIEDILLKLYNFGVKQVVLTSVVLEDGKIGTASYDGKNIEYYFKDRIEGYFHGSGDVYSSSLLAALLKGLSLKEAVIVATEYTYSAIKRTKDEKTPVRYGVNFEEEIPTLLKLLDIK